MQINKMQKHQAEVFKRLMHCEDKKFKINQSKHYNSLITKLQEQKSSLRSH